ncbi:MAG TPA: hypothetical protein VGG75_37760 [Trebonia sp.]
MSGENETAQGHGITEQVRGWFAGRLPDEWFTGSPEIILDREEITVVGTIPAPGRPGSPKETGAAEAGTAQTGTAQTGTAQAGTAEADAGETATEREAAAAVAGRIKRFREETRAARIDIAKEAERIFGRKVAWGVRCGDHEEMFTTLSVPVMTRLRQAERRVLDTLVDAGVARSRSDALAWCVRLTGEHAESWLTELRDALRRVEEVRAQGPTIG